MNTVRTMDPSRREQLAAILDMSLAMLDLARGQQWQELEAMEVRRRVLVADGFRNPATADEAVMVADFITRILEVNREITAEAEAGRREIGNRIQGIGAGKQAQQAYRQYLR